MNIVLVCDNNFAPYAATVVASILRNDKKVHFFILTDDMTSENEHLLVSMTKDMGGFLDVVRVDGKLFADFPMPSNPSLKHIGISTYFRLFVELLLPKSVDKLIYLDCDIVVRKSLQPLYDTDISEYYLGAVYHSDDLSINNGAFKRLDIPISQGYFNAGVLLINLRKWREDGIYNQCVNYLHSNKEKIVNHDQDVLNVVCGKKTKMLSFTWNCMNGFLMTSFLKKTDKISLIYTKDLEEIIRDPAVLHFAFRPKPWEIICIHPYRKDFRDCIKLTPYKKIRYKMPLIKDVINYLLKPNIMGYARYRRIKKLR